MEDVQKLVEDLKPMDVGGPGLDSEEGESRGASMTRGHGRGRWHGLWGRQFFQYKS